MLSFGDNYLRDVILLFQPPRALINFSGSFHYEVTVAILVYKTMKWRPYRCTEKILRGLNFFLMLKFSFVPRNLNILRHVRITNITINNHVLSLRGVITNSGSPISRKTKANDVLLWFKLQLFEELNNTGETLTQN